MPDMDGRDFTIHKLRCLCVAMAEYMDNQHPDRFVLMRHDIDRKPGNALNTARIEASRE